MDRVRLKNTFYFFFLLLSLIWLGLSYNSDSELKEYLSSLLLLFLSDKSFSSIISSSSES